MLLRRITEHVKDQNWTAVTLDFIIVVVGVFFGLQVSNWNDARGELQKERAYLVELRREVEANNIALERKTELIGIVIDSGERALVFLEGDSPCATNCWRLLVDFFLASQVLGQLTSNTILEEMQRQGLPSSRNIRQALKAYSFNDAATANISRNLPKYREHIRSLISIKAQRALWRECHQAGEDEKLFPDCEANVNEAEAQAILEKFRMQPGLHEQLNFWIGHNVFTQPILALQVEFGNAVIAAIDNELAE